jgi:stage V sporulation protein G
MPSRKTKNGEYKDVAHPINTDFRNMLQDRIIESYDAMDSEDSMTGME